MWTWIVKLVTGLFTGWLGEKSRDAAHESLGAEKAKNKGLEDSLERAENAKKVSDDIAGLDDDALDERLRNPRSSRED